MSSRSGFDTLSGRPIELLVRVSTNHFFSPGEPFSLFCRTYWRIHHGEIVVHVPFPSTALCSDLLVWGWCVLVQVLQHMFVPIRKGGHRSCSAPIDWIAFEAWVFQTIGASSFYIFASPRNFLNGTPPLCGWFLQCQLQRIEPLLFWYRTFIFT